MENNKLSNVACTDHLPEDLWRNILSRLPSKSLVRLRSVSKSFQSLINEPGFHRLHLKSFKNNVDESLVLVLKPQENSEYSRSELRCSKTWVTKSEEEQVHDNIGPNWHIIRSRDGLVMLKTFKRNKTGLRDLKLWNPSIRKFHDLPPVPEIETCVENSFTDSEIGVGYDSLIKDYKHLKLVFKDDNVLHLVAVYTLGVGSWKIVPFQGEGFSNWHLNCRSVYPVGVFLRGSLYFLYYNQDFKMTELVSFDLSSMLFSSTNLPDAADLSVVGAMLTLVDGGCSVAVWSDFRHADKPIWVLESESRTWTKRYSVHLNDPYSIMWMLERDLDGWNFFSFNFVTKERKIMPGRPPETLNSCEYVESLILPN